MSIDSVFKLLLYPKEAYRSFSDTQFIVDALQDIEFICKTKGIFERNHYHIGDKFFDYVTFLGCSPAFKTEPDQTGALDFLHIEMSESTEKANFHYNSLGVQARCFQCKSKLNNVLDKVMADKADLKKTQFSCAKCEVNSDILNINWRNTACFVNQFIAIHQVFPHEAIPNESLLLLLQDVTNTPWHYSYADLILT